jgi:hypothetical protein
MKLNTGGLHIGGGQADVPKVILASSSQADQAAAAPLTLADIAKTGGLAWGQRGPLADQAQDLILKLNPDAKIGSKNKDPNNPNRQTPDGIWQDKSIAALKEVQAKYGLEANGKLDQTTLDRLQQEVAKLENPTSKNAPVMASARSGTAHNMHFLDNIHLVDPIAPQVSVASTNRRYLGPLKLETGTVLDSPATDKQTAQMTKPEATATAVKPPDDASKTDAKNTQALLTRRPLPGANRPA